MTLRDIKDSSCERFFPAVHYKEITRATPEHDHTLGASAFMHVGFHKPRHWDFILMFKPKPSSCSLLMRGEGQGQGNVQRLEHSKEKSKERRQCPRKTTACLSFGDKLLLRAGLHESHGSWGNVLALAKPLSLRAQLGLGTTQSSQGLVHEQSLVQLLSPQDT